MIACSSCDTYTEDVCELGCCQACCYLSCVHGDNDEELERAIEHGEIWSMAACYANINYGDSHSSEG